MPATQVQISRRPETAADDQLIADLFAESRPDLDLLPPDSRATLIDLQLRAQRAHHAAAHPDARHEILVAEGRDVGRIVVDVSASETRIVDLVVAREHRRQGIATGALTDVLAEAGERSQPVGLSVWPTNHPALDLYTGLGFEAVVDRGDGTHIDMRREAPEPKDRP